jgi:carbamoylphosphate synthase large subunit
MTLSKPLTVLCLASYEKGHEFLRECKRQKCRVLLLTSQSISGAAWPNESIDEIYLMPDEDKKWRLEDVIKSVSYLGRTESIDRIVPLDDFDLETAAALREHLRTPGMGETSTRYFRDKLAMRTRAQEAGIPVPEFIHVLNYDRLRKFMAQVPGPWLLKPRFEASAVGIKKINHPDELWPALDELGDRQSYHLLERFIPGDIYHVDSIVSEREVVFAVAHRYGKTPFDVAHNGGVFTTSTLLRGSEDDLELVESNGNVLRAMGLVRGASHTEFIRAHSDGRFYFLETAARVGGANIAELVEAATNINLWAEWAKLEIIKGERPYELPPQRNDYAGLIVSLAKQKSPDTSQYDDPEIVWRMQKHHHAGLIVMSPDHGRVQQLLADYTKRFYEDFYTSEPAPNRAQS